MYSDAEPDQSVRFGFSASGGGELELAMDMSQGNIITPTTGWNLIPHARPLKVTDVSMKALFGELIVHCYAQLCASKCVVHIMAPCMCVFSYTGMYVWLI